MAGQGAKKFPAFSKLSSDDVNGYLSSQVIMRFATTTARDAAFGGTGEFTLAEGMTCYIDADNSIYTYDGSNWVKMVSASNPVGLELVKTQTIGTGVSSVTVTNAFSAEYDNYRILVGGMVGTGNDVFQLRMEGATGANYDTQMIYSSYTSGTAQGAGTSNGTFWNYMGSVNTSACTMDLEIFSPYKTTYTTVRSNFWTSLLGAGTTNGVHKLATSYTGFTFFPSAGTLTGGTIRVYGYRN